MRRWLTVIAVALPGLALAVAGYHHPGGLDLATANMWWTAHVPLIAVFPLLGVVLWALVRDERGPLKALVVIGAYVYGCFYTALDCLAGIAAGLVLEKSPRGGASSEDHRADPARGSAVLRRHGGLPGRDGGRRGGLLLRRAGPVTLPGSVLLVGAAIPFQTSHIFSPTPASGRWSRVRPARRCWSGLAHARTPGSARRQ